MNTEEIVKKISPNMRCSTANSKSNQLTDIVVHALEKNYQKYSRMPTLFEEETQSIDNFVANLAIIRNKNKSRKSNTEEEATDQKEGNEKKYSKDSSIPKKGHKINLESLFNGFTSSDGTYRILIEGNAGIGKTTLCHYICYKWANQLICKNNLIFFLPLRKLKQERYYKDVTLNLAKALYLICLDEKTRERINDVLFSEFLLQQSNVIVILDGYDEIAHCCYEEDNPIKKVLSQAFENFNTVMTSRPEIYPLDLEIDLLIETTGLQDENITAFIQNYLTGIPKNERETKNITSASIESLLQSKPQLRANTRSPMTLSIMLKVICESPTLYDVAQLTLTELYSQMIGMLLRRYLRKQQQLGIFQNEINWHDLTHTEIFSFCADELEFLEMLAFEAGLLGDLIIPKSFVDSVLSHLCHSEKNDFQNKKHSLLTRSLKTGLLTKLKIGKDTLFQFKHLSIQEFLSARYIKHGLDSAETNNLYFNNIINFIEVNKYRSELQLVFSFVAGLVSLQGSTHGKTPDSLCYFWDALICYGQDPTHCYHYRLLSNCLNESCHDGLVDERIPHLSYIRSYLYKLLFLSSRLRDELLMDGLGNGVFFLMKLLIQKIIKGPNFYSEKSRVLKALTHLVDSGQNEASEIVLSALDDSNKDIQRCAVEVLTPLLERGNEKAINIVMPILKSPKSWSIEVKLKQLRVGANRGDESDIEVVLTVLERVDLAPSLRKLAIETLEYPIKSKHKKTILALKSAVRDNDIASEAALALLPLVRKGYKKAIYAIMYSRRLYLSPTVDALISSIESGHNQTIEIILKYLQSSNCSALKKRVAIKASSPLIVKRNKIAIECVTDGLYHTDPPIRRSAVEAFKLAIIDGFEDPIPDLLRIIQNDSDTSVQCAAIKTVAHLVKIHHQETIRILFQTSLNSDGMVRTCAIKAIGILAKNGHQKAISILLQSTQSTISSVYNAAFKELCPLVKTGNEDIIKAFLYAHKKHELYNHTPICYLGPLVADGNQIAINIVIEALNYGNRLSSDLKYKFKTGHAFEALMPAVISGNSEALRAIMGHTKHVKVLFKCGITFIKIKERIYLVGPNIHKDITSKDTLSLFKKYILSCRLAAGENLPLEVYTSYLFNKAIVKPSLPIPKAHDQDPQTNQVAVINIDMGHNNHYSNNGDINIGNINGSKCLVM